MHVNKVNILYSILSGQCIASLSIAGSVSLSSNVTLQGPLGGEGIELTCQVWEGYKIEWSIDNRTVSTYEVEETTLEKAPFHLHSSLPGVATAIVMVTPSSSHPGLFYIRSTFISDVRTLGPLFCVECFSDAGRGQVVANLSSGSANSSSGLVAAKPSVKLTSNATSLHGDECGEIIQFICQLNEELYVDWVFGVKEIAHYDYNKSDEDRYPFEVKLEDSSFSSLNVSITKIKTHMLNKKVDLTSTLTINADELVSHNIHTISCGGKDSLDNVTIDLQHNCTIPDTPLSPAAYVTLSSNDTTGLQGNICPGGAEMTCATRNVPYMAWYINDVDNQVVMVANYSFIERQQFPVNLCDSAKGNEALDEFCNNSGSIKIDVATQGEGEGVYNFNSTLVARESYIRKQDYQNVQCGSDEARDTILTNFTVSCKLFLESRVTLTSNGTSDSHVELMCHGQDVSSLWWTYNNNTESITKPYHTPPNSSQHIPSLVPHVEVTMVTSDEEDDLDNNFNYESLLSFDCNNVRYMRSIECGSEDIRQQFIVNCKLATKLHYT